MLHTNWHARMTPCVDAILRGIIDRYRAKSRRRIFPHEKTHANSVQGRGYRTTLWSTSIVFYWLWSKEFSGGEFLCWGRHMFRPRLVLSSLFTLSYPTSQHLCELLSISSVFMLIQCLNCTLCTMHINNSNYHINEEISMQLCTDMLQLENSRVLRYVS